MATDEPPEDPFARMAAERRALADAHEALREGAPFRDALHRVDRLVTDYGLAVNAIDLMATRHPPYFGRLITLRLKPRLMESLIAAAQAVKEGLHDPARRELRFLLEASVKTLWLDSGCPTIGDGSGRTGGVRPATVTGKVAALDDLGREHFGEVVDSLAFRLMDAKGIAKYRQTAKSLYRQLSTHVHVSTRPIARDLKAFDRDRHIGFETIGDVNAIVDLMRQVLDLALASHLEAFDGGLVGDIFTALLDDMARWSFHRTPLVAAVSRHFDYKVERQDRRT